MGWQRSGGRRRQAQQAGRHLASVEHTVVTYLRRGAAASIHTHPVRMCRTPTPLAPSSSFSSSAGGEAVVRYLVARVLGTVARGARGALGAPLLKRARLVGLDAAARPVRTRDAVEPAHHLTARTHDRTGRVAGQDSGSDLRFRGERSLRGNPSQHVITNLGDRVARAPQHRFVVRDEHERAVVLGGESTAPSSASRRAARREPECAVGWGGAARRAREGGRVMTRVREDEASIVSSCRRARGVSAWAASVLPSFLHPLLLTATLQSSRRSTSAPFGGGVGVLGMLAGREVGISGGWYVAGLAGWQVGK